MTYCRDVPGEIRLAGRNSETEDAVGTIEPLELKILYRGSRNNPEEVKLEVTSGVDLFVHYTHRCTEKEFRQLSDHQKLLVEMRDYPNVLMKMANNAIKEPHSFVLLLTLRPDATAALSFVQNLEYKYVELLRINLEQSREDVIRQSISYRHHTVRSKLAMLHARLEDVAEVLRTKNPNLLQEIARCTQILSSTCPAQLKSPYAISRSLCDPE